MLAGQTGIAGALFEHHAAGLGDGEALWEPAQPAWTVRRGDDGRWAADWQVPEPDPVPATTIAWTLWHIDYWWTTVLEHCFGDGAPDRAEIRWPGSAADAIDRVRALHERWDRALREAGEGALDSGERTAELPLFAGMGLTLGQVAAWVPVEFTKNTAEIGAVRHLYALRGPGAGTP